MQTLHYASGPHLLEIQVREDLNLELHFEKNSKGSFILKIEGQGNLDLKVNFERGSSWSFLALNKSEQELNIKEHFTLDAHVDLKLNYGELSHGISIKDSVYEFIGQDSHLNLKGASIVFNQLNWKLKALHHAKRSFAHLDNHALVLENGKLVIEVSGQIDKGYSGSETHQMTRVMNLGESINALVFPKLLIDENDVAASHAAAVGQPNEEHIYYLQARGIDRTEALKLLMKGYLLPITEDIENKAIKTELIEEIEAKVNAQWT